MYEFIELLRAVAALLITNSHFDGVYPWNSSRGGGVPA
jgi:peptidoglycan/LPS O-acetylase OafA/YrhL